MVLTGEGSDELFDGYPRYRPLMLASWLRIHSSTLLRELYRPARKVTLELDGETYPARAVVTQGEDRDDLFRRICENVPIFGT